MKKALIAWSVLVVAVLGIRTFAQPTYDKGAETTVAGTVRYVLSAANTDGVVGVHLEVTTPSGPVRVALAPALFIASNNYYFFVDEQVYVVGAKVKPTGEIWARTISKDGKNFLILRDEDGTPRWERATEDDPDGCGVSHAPIR
jgi:hypothetical protein